MQSKYLISYVCVSFFLIFTMFGINMSNASVEAGENKPISQPLLCEGCMALVNQLHRHLKDSMGRKRLITSTLDGICKTDNFVIYRFSPPKMLKVCKHLTERYRDLLENSLHVFYKKYRVKEPKLYEEEFCDKISSACEPGQREIQRNESSPVGMNIEEANRHLNSDEVTPSGTKLKEL